MRITHLQRQDIVKGGADDDGNRPRALVADDQVYQIDSKPFAQGGWGRVFFCRNTQEPGRLHVYKELYLQPPRRRALPVQLTSHAGLGREMDALEALQPDVLLAAINLRGKRFGLVLTLQDGTLADAIPKLRDMQVGKDLLMSNLALQMARAVRHMHAHDPVMVHNDVKPGNMFYRRTNGGIALRLLDFGMSFELDDARTAPINTSAYSAPESLDGTVCTAADMWGLGLSVMRLTGEHPFQMFADEFEHYDPMTDLGKARRRVIYRVFFAARDGRPNPARIEARHAALIARCWARVNNLNPGLRDLVKELLAGNPACRPGVEEAEARLQALNSQRRGAPAWHILPKALQVPEKLQALRHAYQALRPDVFAAQQSKMERDARAV